MIGRLRSLPMTVVGALVLGLADSYAIGYLPSDNQYLTTFRFVIPTVVLFVVLLALPNPQLRTRATSASREHVPLPSWRPALLTAGVLIGASRSEERRVGKECVRPCGSRGSPTH